MTSDREELLGEVRNHVNRAAGLLRVLGPDYERLGWLLEDVLTFLRADELEGHDDSLDDIEITPLRKIEAR